MNNGFYGFPQSNYGTSVIEVKEFDSSGTYQIPNGTKRLWIMLIGGGQGGGGGLRGATGGAGNIFAGSGGGAGTINTAYYFVDTLGGSSESTPSASGSSPNSVPSAWGKLLAVTIGAGGIGGAGATADNTATGAVGTDGGYSTVTLTGYPGYLMVSAGTSNYPIINGIYTGTFEFTTNGTRTPRYGVSYDSFGTFFILPTGVVFDRNGADGGYVAVNGDAFPGSGIASYPEFSYDPTASAISDPFRTTKLGGNTGTAVSQVSEQLSLYGPYSPGLGGVGGGASTTTAANNGTDGWRGGGGGGGGASVNGFTSGAGGNGGNGYCVIVALGM